MLRARSHWVAALVLASIMATAAVASAADTPSSGAPRYGHGKRFQQALGLTDDQMSSIRQLFAQHAADRKQLSQSLRKAQADLRQLALTSGDPAAIQAKQAEVVQLMNQSVTMRVESLQAIAPILTPEQRAKLAQMGFGRGGRHWHQQDS